MPTTDQLPNEATEDHIFPEFLGGRRTILACRSCNTNFGHSFEGVAADLLIRPYVQLAVWKVPLPKTNQWWNRACRISETELHLSVGEHGIEAKATKPIIIRDESGEIDEAFFPDKIGREKFLKAMARKDPNAKWMPAEKRIDANLPGLRLYFPIGPSLQQLALKICLAATALLPKCGLGIVRKPGRSCEFFRPTRTRSHPSTFRDTKRSRTPGLRTLTPCMWSTSGLVCEDCPVLWRVPASLRFGR
ncbi:MAG TPA: HNH endonuclease [Bryobacteraceae bacterium]|jgi:hypothetical protein